MSNPSIFAAAFVLSTLMATAVTYARAHRHVRKAPQHINNVRPSQDHPALGRAYAAPQPPAVFPSQRTCWRYFGGPTSGAWAAHASSQ
jgi:hypothetical protein